MTCAKLEASRLFVDERYQAYIWVSSHGYGFKHQSIE